MFLLLPTLLLAHLSCKNTYQLYCCPFLCRWFSYQTNPFTAKEDWLFNNDYWKRNWKDCPQIF
ncbi:hypothetical protein BsWGS_14335 [Bradybaena similaris]